MSTPSSLTANATGPLRVRDPLKYLRIRCLTYVTREMCCGEPMLHGRVEVCGNTITACLVCGKGLPADIAAEVGLTPPPTTDGSTVYDIANPSDPYTIKGPFMPCAIAVVLLGNGAYGIKGTPILFGWDSWLKENGIENLEFYIDTHALEIADALDTVLIGNERDREEVEGTLAMLAPERHKEWLAQRHDKKRSSLNDIGGRARKYADRLRSGRAAKDATLAVVQDAQSTNPTTP